MSGTSFRPASWKPGQRLAWPLEQWPEADCIAWNRARQAGGLLEEDGLAANWRPATIRSALSVYGRFLAFLDQEDLLITGHGPADRFLPAVLARYVAGLQSVCASVTVATYVVILAKVVQAMAPDQDWSWLFLMHRKLQRRAKPSRNKRVKVVPAAELYAFGHDLMRQGLLDGPRQKDRLLAFRDGLMIATLISRPLRVSNFVSIEIGRQLSQAGADWALSFTGEETKNRQPLQFSYPTELTEALEYYLAVIRPELIALGRKRYPQGRGPDPGEHLWISLNGTALRAEGLTRVLKTRMPNRFGHMINPHLFRDCAATSIMTEIPKHVRIAARVLGHATLQTTERHYILANTRQELRRHQQDVLALRRSQR